MNTPRHPAHDPDASGVSFTSGAGLAALEHAAREAGLWVKRIDLHDCRDKAALLDRLARGLDAPNGQGRNWDALADLLRDLGWLAHAPGRVLLFAHASTLQAADPGAFSTLLSILEDASAHWRARGVPLRAAFALPRHAHPAPGRGRGN